MSALVKDSSWSVPSAPQLFDFRCRLGCRPILEQPPRQRVISAAQRQLLVLVAAAIWEKLQRTGQLVIDLEAVSVGIGEIQAALVEVVDGPQDLDAVFQKMGVSLAQRGIAADAKGDVHEPHLSALRVRCVAGRGVLRDVKGVVGVAQRHENAPVIGVFLSDPEPEHIAIEALGGLLVGDPQEDTADALEVGCTIDPLRFRANFYIDGANPWEEFE